MSGATSGGGDVMVARDEVPRTFPRFRRAGPLVFVSAAGIDPGAPRERGEERSDIREQTAACIERLRHTLEKAGGGLENLVDVTSYLVSMNDFGGYNDIYSKYFSPDGPARTTIAVHQLSHPDSLIEIRGTAYIIESVGASAKAATEDFQR